MSFFKNLFSKNGDKKEESMVSPEPSPTPVPEPTPAPEPSPEPTPAPEEGIGQGEGPGRQPEGFGAGPDGECVCSSCGAKAPHQTGIPCYEQKCPKCGQPMTRG